MARRLLDRQLLGRLDPLRAAGSPPRLLSSPNVPSMLARTPERLLGRSFAMPGLLPGRVPRRRLIETLEVDDGAGN